MAKASSNAEIESTLSDRVAFGKVVEVVKRTGFCGSLTLVKVHIDAEEDEERDQTVSRIVQGPVEVGDIIRIS